MKIKKAIVTGSSGVIGRVLVKMLVEQGVDVAGIDIVPPKNKAGFVFIQHDLSKEETFPYPIITDKNTVIFHLAAVFERTRENGQYYKHSFKHNVVGTHNLLRMLEGADFGKFIFASSYLVYDENQYQDKDGVVYLKEGVSPIKPRNIVGAAKYFDELEIEHWCKLRKLDYVNARICRVYGIDSKDVVGNMVRSSLNNEKFTVYNSSGQFDYIYADDVAEGLIRLAQVDFTGDVNLGFGSPGSVYDIVATVELLNPNYKFKREVNEQPLEQSCVDMNLFMEHVRWLPQTTLYDGIQKVWEYESTKVAKTQ